MTAVRDVNDQPDPPPILAFDVLSMIGLLSYLIILITAFFSKGVKRLPTWYIFMGSWLFFCFGELLLLGQQFSDAPPPFELCLFQSALIYAGPPFAASAGCALILQTYLTISLCFGKKQPDAGLNKQATYSRLLVLFVPPIICCLVIIEVAVMGSVKPHAVQRDSTRMYCNLADGTSAKISGAIVAICLLCMITLQCILLRIMYRHWSASEKLRAQSNGTVSRGSVARMALFVLLASAGFISCFFSFKRGNQAFASVHLISASLPVGVVFVCGLQGDIIQVWFPCLARKRRDFISSTVRDAKIMNEKGIIV